MNKPNKVILHCSATPDRGDMIGAEQIRDWHVNDNGWSDIGYHYVIRRSGLIEKGREENVIGSHTKGYNKDSLGVCLVGTNDFTSEQISSLKVLFRQIKNSYKIEPGNWFCHYQFSTKTCPNLPVEVLRELLRMTT